MVSLQFTQLEEHQTSAAARAEVALSDMMEAADCSRESTFKKFYHRSAHSEECIYYGCFERSGFLRYIDTGESGTDQVNSLH